MLVTDDRAPTWTKVKPDGSRFVTYDSDLTAVQLLTLDKIVENIELNYNNSSSSSNQQSTSDSAAAPVFDNKQPSSSSTYSSNNKSNTDTMSNVPMSNSYMYMKHKDLSEEKTWEWRDSCERQFYSNQPPEKRVTASAKPKLDSYKEEEPDDHHDDHDHDHDDAEPSPLPPTTTASDKSEDNQPPALSLLYNCYSRQTSDLMRSYLSKLYHDLVKSIGDEETSPATTTTTKKSGVGKRMIVVPSSSSEEEEEEEEGAEEEPTTTQPTEFLELPKSAIPPSPFPRIVPLQQQQQQQPRSIMKNSSRNSSTNSTSNNNNASRGNKYEQKLLDIYKDLTQERLRRVQKSNEYDLDLDEDEAALLDEDEMQLSTRGRMHDNNNTETTFRLPKPSDYLSIEKYASYSNTNNSSKSNNSTSNMDDTDLDQDMSTSSSVVRTQQQQQQPRITPPPPIQTDGSVKRVSGYVSGRNSTNQTVYQSPARKFNGDIYSKNNTNSNSNFVNRPAMRRDTEAREATYYPSANQPRYSVATPNNNNNTSNNNRNMSSNSSSKLRLLSENADRMVENINKKWQPSKSQLGHLKDVSRPNEPKIKVLHSFSSKFIDKANRFQHHR